MAGLEVIMLLWGPVTLHQPPVDYPEKDEADLLFVFDTKTTLTSEKQESFFLAQFTPLSINWMNRFHLQVGSVVIPVV